jgi:chromosome segregation ATPase
MDLKNLELLEERLTNLITRIKTAEEKIKTQEDELKKAQAQIDTLNEERVTILKKIEELLSRLDF